MIVLNICYFPVECIYLFRYTQHSLVLVVYCLLIVVYNDLLSHYLVLCVYTGVVFQQLLHNLRVALPTSFQAKPELVSTSK